MHWFGIAFMLLTPLGISIYTINFGRWMAKRKIRSGAIGAYVIAVIAFGLSAYVLIRNSM